jgi:CRISPR-associated exonuclease Cas4
MKEQEQGLTLTKEQIFLTPSEIIEYLFCPRFIYFIHCLNIPQHEEQRFKVLMGREVHEKKAKLNKDYLRKKINCIKRENLVYLVSERYHLKGEVDEILYLEDNTMSPLDYKFTEYKERLYRTHKIQSTLYALLIMDNYECEVKRGFLCYVRSKNLIKEITFKKSDFMKINDIIKEMLLIIQNGYFPKATPYKLRCIDCCYKNICLK